MRIVRLLGVALLTSCGERPANRLTDETAMRPARSPVLEATREPGPLATRQEAKESFDSARAALLRSDLRAAARHLADAAAFMRMHTARAEVGAIAALQASTKELEVLSDRLARGETQTVRTFDRVSANASRAEAQHHFTRAIAALADRAYPSAGEELLMAVDHLERAAYDLHHARDSEANTALAPVRALADRMVHGDVPSRAEVKRVSGAFMTELRRVCSVIDVEAAACAVEAAR